METNTLMKPPVEGQESPPVQQRLPQSGRVASALPVPLPAGKPRLGLPVILTTVIVVFSLLLDAGTEGLAVILNIPTLIALGFYWRKVFRRVQAFLPAPPSPSVIAPEPAPRIADTPVSPGQQEIAALGQPVPAPPVFSRRR
jgi:hypothetical protein